MYVNPETQNRITVEIVKDSITPKGVRLTTVILNIPRIVLAELNTHRKFSRNSASSRAIPFDKMAQKVIEEPFIPMAFQKTHKGMQGTEYFNETQYNSLKEIWLDASTDAVANAKTLDTLGVTKQITNRLLEPFLYHKVLVTATTFENFTALRYHEAAEIHIAESAKKLLEALNNSVPQKIGYLGLHLPFLDNSDISSISNIVNANSDLLEKLKMINENMLKYYGLNNIELACMLVSAGKCARTSYNDFDGKCNYVKDMALALDLVEHGHWSPQEHQAICMDNDLYPSNFDNGWTQFRSLFKYQDRKDNRINKQ